MTSEAAPTTAAPGPAARPRRRALGLGIAVLVAVAVVLAALWAGGYLFAAKSSSGPGPPYETFDQAKSEAASAVGPTGGGPWSPLVAFGLATPANVTVPALNLTSLDSLSKCTVNWTAGSPPTVAVPLTPSSTPPGTAAFWVVGFVNGSSYLRLALVAAGVPSVLATLAGNSCTGLFALAKPLSDQPIVDSPVVALNTSAAGAGPWLASHANATLTWEIVPGVNAVLVSSPPMWYSVYTTCSLGGTGPSLGAEFTANLTAATGYVQAHTNGSVTCASGGGLSLAHVPWPSPFSARKAI
ncbi:MAG TPA: hypothetical protein VMG81_00945 [Thermoplasmata archaeon]|nr:hypothetical protein [Thermoplasmata archaeon]